MSSDSSNEVEQIFESFPLTSVQIGVGKYVLIRLSLKGKSKVVLRQDTEGTFHRDVAESTMELGRSKGVACQILGGGRIDFDAKNKKIFIYGYSVDFGMANHALAKELLSISFPEYTITWSNEGY